MGRLLLAALIALAPALAFAQTATLQGGPWPPGHAPMYSSPAGAQPVLQDSGAAQGGASGIGLNELLQVNRGTGTAPYANTGTGPLSSHACFYDGPTTGAYHYLCLDANANGGPLITVGYGGGASPLPLGIIVNGTAAVTCSGSPTSSFATSGGIVTHC